jgi:hypothetical protein
MNALAQVQTELAERHRRHVLLSRLYTDALCADPELTNEQAREVLVEMRAIADAPLPPGSQPGPTDG